MKRSILFFTLIVTINSLLNAQSLVGPKFGMNLARIHDGEDAPSGYKDLYNVGFNAGIAGNFGLGENAALAIEFLFSQKGSYQKSENNDDFHRLETNYLEIPVMPRFLIGSDAVKFYLNAGPSFGYWLGGKTEYKTTTTLGILDDEIQIDFNDTSNDYNRLEIGGQAGLGLLFAAGPGSFMIDARYGVGFTDFDGDDTIKAKNGVVGLSIAYLLGGN